MVSALSLAIRMSYIMFEYHYKQFINRERVMQTYRDPHSVWCPFVGCVHMRLHQQLIQISKDTHFGSVPGYRSCRCRHLLVPRECVYTINIGYVCCFINLWPNKVISTIKFVILDDPLWCQRTAPRQGKSMFGGTPHFGLHVFDQFARALPVCVRLAVNDRKICFFYISHPHFLSQ